MKPLKFWSSILCAILLLMSACKENGSRPEVSATGMDTTTAFASDTTAAPVEEPNESNFVNPAAENQTATAKKTKLPTNWMDDADTKLTRWTAYHGKSLPEFSVKKFVAIDTFQEMDFPELPMEKTDAGFEEFRIASPDGQRQLDIYCFERKLKKAKGKASPTGMSKNSEVALLNTNDAGNKTRLLFCDAHCNFDDAVWLDNNTLVVAGYSDEVDKKFHPMLWRIDLKNKSVWRYLYPDELPTSNKTYIKDIVFAQ